MYCEHRKASDCKNTCDVSPFIFLTIIMTIVVIVHKQCLSMIQSAPSLGASLLCCVPFWIVVTVAK